MRLHTSEIAELTGGRVIGEPVVVDGATQDSRALVEGQLFVPLVAERDGHDFVSGALARGAAAYLTAREHEGGTAVVVDDTALALRQLAIGVRARLAAPVVGITGSVGKTSTKDLLAGALRSLGAVHASPRSFNNDIGVPLTLLNAPDGADAVVVEMGSRGIGHIRSLCEVAAPTVGIVTTVAAAHTGEFGSLDAIAEAKGELVESLPPDGLAVLNGDVAHCTAMAPRTDAEVLTFGRSPDCDVRLVSVELDAELRATVRIDSPWGEVTATPATRGAHLAPNAAAAAAAALWLGVAPDAVGEGLAAASVSPWRMEVGRTRTGAVVINDSYNANPTSTRGALDSLAALDHRRKVAVLGYMAELGEGEGADHRDIAEHARALGLELVAVGTDLYGQAPVDDALAAVGGLDAETAVLVKASRAAGLETVARALLDA